MKQILIWATIYILLTFVSGCSTSSAPESKTKEEPSKAAVNSTPNINDPGSSSLTSQPGNFQDRHNRWKNRVQAEPNAKPEPLVFRPAPENSETATTMTDDGSILEIRVFKGHPHLAKVEATWTEPTDKSLKVYLKNGTVVDIKTDRIGNLRDTPSIEIMQVAGIRSTGKNAPASRLVDKK